MARRRRATPSPEVRQAGRRGGAPPSRVWAIATLILAGAAGSLVYNVLAPRGIFYPEAAALPGEPPAAAAAAKAEPPTRDATVTPAKVKPVSAASATALQASAPPSGPYAPEILSLEQAGALFKTHTAVWVDARSPEVYAFGHVPGALNLPYLDPEAGFANLSSQLPRTGRLVVYCTSAECDEADQVLAMLIKHGYRNLSHFKEGWNVWEITDLPQEKGPKKP